MYSYDQLKEILEVRMREASREEPDGERAVAASQRYERFVADGLVPEDFSRDVGALVTW